MLQHLSGGIAEDNHTRVEVRSSLASRVFALEGATDLIDAVSGHQCSHHVVERRDDFFTELWFGSFFAKAFRFRRLMSCHRLLHQLRHVDRDCLAVGRRQFQQTVLVDLIIEFAWMALLHPLDVCADVVRVRAVRPQRSRAFKVIARVRQVRPVGRLHLVVAVVPVDRVLEELLTSVAPRAQFLSQLRAGLDPLLVFGGCLRVLQTLLVVLEQRLHGFVHQLPLTLPGRVGHLRRPALHRDRVAVRHAMAVLRVGLVDHVVVLRTRRGTGALPVAGFVARNRGADFFGVVRARFEGVHTPVDRLRRSALGDVLPVLVAPALLQILLALIACALTVEIEVADRALFLVDHVNRVRRVL